MMNTIVSVEISLEENVKEELAAVKESDGLSEIGKKKKTTN